MPRTIIHCLECKKEIPANITKRGLAEKLELYSLQLKKNITFYFCDKYCRNGGGSNITFDLYSSQWEEAIKYLSTSEQQKSHHLYSKIKDLGGSIIPLIIKRISIKPFLAYFDLLSELTGEKPEVNSIEELIQFWNRYEMIYL